MPKLTVNGQIIEVDEGCTVLQACEKANVEVPVFCYHPKLSIAGNCRMCLVELDGSPKLVASCAMPASEGMAVRTTSHNVKKARKETLELLLINHPLDCPICDQGGECDLQDLTVAYGPSSSRFHLNKRAVSDKYMGPLIKTSMTRCIHCTRCIRFANEVAGIPELGALGRGENLEITSYLEGAIQSELSGNMIDICPVGALTSKPYAFQHRSWELNKTDSIDALDAVGSNISVHSKGQEVVRILPRSHDDINEEWITDRARFSYDGLKKQRLDQPYVRVDEKLQPATWEQAFAAISEKISGLKPHEMAALAGNLADCDAIFSLRLLLDQLKVLHRDCRIDGSLIPYTNRGHYISNTSIAGLEKADCILLIGTNPRTEASIINARIRKRFLQGDLSVGLVGQQVDLTYPYHYLGDNLSDLNKLLNDKDDFSKKLASAKFPVIIVGSAIFDSSVVENMLDVLQNLIDRYNVVRDDCWNGFNVLHTAAARVGALDVGFYPSNDGYDINGILKACEKKEIKFLYLLGVDEVDVSSFGNTFIVYQGHHGDQGAHSADVVLPGAAYTEKTAIYVNTEGRPQYVQQAVEPPGQAKEDWRIIRALSEKLGKTLPFSNQQDLWLHMASENPIFSSVGKIQSNTWEPLTRDKKTFKKNFGHQPLQLAINNFYMNDVITRHSSIMANCVQEILKQGDDI